MTTPWTRLLASNRLFRRDGDDFVWPYEITVSLRESGPVIGIGEGVGHGAAGGMFSPQEALGRRAHFAKAQGEWLIPHIERMARGERVTAEELVEQFEQIHGRTPPLG
ncbi:hypothetical protein [Arenivirga flava]|nr:hypothetical protein [Arenivirga flava]